MYGYDRYDELPREITAGQKRCIYTLAKKELGMTDDDIHAMTYRVAGVDHVRELTLAQAKGMIEQLKEMAGQESNVTRQGKPTPRQLGMIDSLTAQLGWDADRQRAFLEKRFGISHIRFLDDTRAWKVIEAMKAMVRGNRGERRLTNSDPDTTMVT